MVEDESYVGSSWELVLKCSISGSFVFYTLPARLSTCYKFTRMALP